MRTYSCFVVLMLLQQSAYGQNSSHHPIKNVRAAFDVLVRDGVTRTYHWKAGDRPAGYFLGKSHFQGITALKSGYYAISGSGNNAGHVFIFKHGSDGKRTIVKYVDVSKTSGHTALHHAGGLQALGDYLAVPLEQKGQDTSIVAFYDASNPKQPRYLYSLIRKNTAGDKTLSQAGAVGLTKLKNGKFFLVVGRSNSNVLDFYTSMNRSLASNPNFFPTTTWYEKNLSGGDREFGNYQNLNLFTETSGRVYLIGTHRNGVISKDWADLFEVNMAASQVTQLVYKVDSKHMTCWNLGNGSAGSNGMDAGGGAFVNANGTLDALAVGPYFGEGQKDFTLGTIVINEFINLSSSAETGWVQFWDDKNFKDRTIRVNYTVAIPDFNKLSVQGKRYGDKVSSVMWNIPVGKTYVLYQHDNYKGKTKRLIGTGKLEFLKELKGFNDEVSSSRLE